MCGIVGIVSRNKNNINENLVKKALTKISHRGPDDVNIYTSDNISFGYVRLAIRGLKKEYNQPIKFKSTISFANGEVYSKNDERIEKDKNDLTPLIEDIVDEELNIYDKYDADFAISLYDNSANLFMLARDYFGVKPLFYSWLDEETLIFSSEIKGLFELLNYKYEYDEDSILDYLLFGYPLYEKTIYKNIYKLEPRTILKWDLNTNKKVKLRKKLSLKYRCEPINVANCLKKSINSRLISNRKVAAHLSGGLDSSLIAYFCRNNLNYYTGYYNESDNDLYYSKKISKEINCRHKLVKLGKVDIKKIINILDAPIMSTGVFVPYQIAKAANKDNVRVILAGQGSDELFLGYTRFNKIKQIRTKKELFNELINADLNMIKKLFTSININSKYKNILNGKDFLKEAQKFYIDNFLTELLHIEDHVHMNYNIENRVPFLGLDIIKFINQYGIDSNCNKEDILNVHKNYNTKVVNRKLKENMNKDLKDILKEEPLEDVVKDKVFSNFNYELFSEYIDNIDVLSKKELYTIWFIYNINVWYKELKFNKKIIIGD